MSLTEITKSILLISVLMIQVHRPVVECYETVELYRYCHRQATTNKFKDIGRLAQNQESGLVIPDSKTETRNGDEEEYSDGDVGDEDGPIIYSFEDGSIVKNVVVGNQGDDSAVRILFADNKNRFRQRNGQYCALYITSRKSTGLIITIRKLNLRSGIDWLRLLINNGSFVREFSHVQINDEKDTVAYVANQGVMIELKTGHSVVSAENDLLDFTITAFREADICHIHEYDCGSFRCISSEFVCDGINNCGDNRDEVSCPDKNVTMYIIIVLLLGLMTLILSTCTVIRCCCTSKRNRRQFQYVHLGNGIGPGPAAVATGTSGPIPYHPRSASQGSVHSDPNADVGHNFRHNSIAGDQVIRRFKLSAVPGSEIIPSAPGIDQTDGYGSTGQTYLLAPTYATVHLGANNYGLVPAHQIFAPSNSRLVLTPGVYNGLTGRPRSYSTQINQSTRRQSHHSVPLPESTYPAMPANLFQPPTSAPPPPYTPREERNRKLGRSKSLKPTVENVENENKQTKSNPTLNAINDNNSNSIAKQNMNIAASNDADSCSSTNVISGENNIKLDIDSPGTSNA